MTKHIVTMVALALMSGAAQAQTNDQLKQPCTGGGTGGANNCH